MGNNSIPKFIFCLSRFPVYRGSVVGRFYCSSIGGGGCTCNLYVKKLKRLKKTTQREAYKYLLLAVSMLDDYIKI